MPSQRRLKPCDTLLPEVATDDPRAVLIIGAVGGAPAAYASCATEATASPYAFTRRSVSRPLDQQAVKGDNQRIDPSCSNFPDEDVVDCGVSVD